MNRPGMDCFFLLPHKVPRCFALPEYENNWVGKSAARNVIRREFESGIVKGTICDNRRDVWRRKRSLDSSRCLCGTIATRHNSGCPGPQAGPIGGLFLSKWLINFETDISFRGFLHSSPLSCLRLLLTFAA